MRIFSIIMLVLSGYLIFQNRYRVLNLLFKSSFLRRIIVRLFLGIPSVQERMMKIAFPSSSSAETN